MIGLNDLLLRTDLDDHQRRLAEGLQSAGLTLLALINDVLDLSKIESGKLELERADFDVRAVFERIAAVPGWSGVREGPRARGRVPPGGPDVPRGDVTRLGQVLSNLGSNAVKFTDPGEVVSPGRLAEQTASGVMLRVAVSDTGVGIDQAAVSRLFDAFTQADLSTTRGTAAPASGWPSPSSSCTRWAATSR